MQNLPWHTTVYITEHPKKNITVYTNTVVLKKNEAKIAKFRQLNSIPLQMWYSRHSYNWCRNHTATKRGRFQCQVPQETVSPVTPQKQWHNANWISQKDKVKRISNENHGKEFTITSEFFLNLYSTKQRPLQNSLDLLWKYSYLRLETSETNCQNNLVSLNPQALLCILDIVRFRFLIFKIEH